VWSIRKARNQALWGSIAIALLVLAFGGGWYSLFTEFIYEGEGNVEGYGLIWVVIAVLVLPIVGAVASGTLLRTGRRIRDMDDAPDGLSYANPILAISILLFLLMYVAFAGSATITEGDFPVGILRVFPVYVGFCIAMYVTGAAFLTWSDSTRLEAGIAMALGWGAFLMFIVYSSFLNPDRVADDGWDQILFWLRFGLLIASILPFLVVMGLWYSYRRALELLDVEKVTTLELDQGADVTVDARASGGECDSCGAVLTEHPRTGEVFCPACGAGLLSEQEVPWPPP
jgi:hypothetical protein